MAEPPSVKSGTRRLAEALHQFATFRPLAAFQAPQLGAKHVRLGHATEQRHRGYLHCASQTPGKTAECSGKRDSRVTHTQTRAANSVSWAAAQILVLFHLSWATCRQPPTHISSEGHLWVQAEFIPSPQDSPLCLCPFQDALSVSRVRLSPGSSRQKVGRFSTGVSDTTVACSEAKRGAHLCLSL